MESGAIRVESPFTVGPFTVDARKNVLEREGRRVRLEPKPMRVLVHLATRAGEDVRKDEILRVVWEESSVRAEVLTNAIWELRKALGDDCREPDFIQTVPRKGYRLVASVGQCPPRESSLSRFARRLAERLDSKGHAGFLEGKRSALLRVLTSRFGTLPSDLATAVLSLDSSESVDRVIDAALSACSFAEVRAVLERGAMPARRARGSDVY